MGMKARELGFPFEGKSGKWNAITDVAGVEVGFCTVIEGESSLDTLPESATVYRWGGEEFIILYRDTSVAEENVGKVLENVRNHRFIFNNQPVQVTISIGLCISDKPAKTIDFDKLLIEADNKLYEAKDSGRNNVKVVHY